MILTPSARVVRCLPGISVPNYRQTCLPAVYPLRHIPSITRPSHHQRHLLHCCFHTYTLRCCATGNTPDRAQDRQQRIPRPFPSFLRRQAFAAVGALLLAVLLVRPLAKSWCSVHKPVPDALPAAVWLPRSTSDEAAKQQACQNNYQTSTFAAISSSIPATSSRLLRISDAFLMQLTVYLQQVSAKLHIPTLLTVLVVETHSASLIHI